MKGIGQISHLQAIGITAAEDWLKSRLSRPDIMMVGLTAHDLCSKEIRVNGKCKADREQTMFKEMIGLCVYSIC